MIKSLRKYVLKSNNRKTVVANFGYLSLLQIAGYVFPLLTMPYLARVIGTEGFGKIAFASAIVLWVLTIADWGFNYTATRDVAQNINDKEKVSEIFSNVLWARCILTFISGVLLFIFVLIIPYLRENWKVIFLTFLMVPGHIFFPDWFFQAVEKMKYTTIFNLLLKFIFTVSVFFVIKEKNDFIYQPLLTTIGYLICGAFSLNLILIRWKFSLKKPNLKSIIITIKSSTDVFINNIVSNLYNSLSILLLGLWCGPSSNGIFDGGNKFVSIFNNLLNVLSRAFYPFLSRRIDKHDLYAKINICTSIAITILLIVSAPWIIDLMLGSDFRESVLVLRILSISIIFLAIGNTYGTNYLILNHNEKILRKITVYTSISGFILAFPLVYYFSYIGAAIVIVLCRGSIGLFSYLFAVKIKTKKHI